jgi:hypothetical protein
MVVPDVLTCSGGNYSGKIWTVRESDVRHDDLVRQVRVLLVVIGSGKGVLNRG